MKITGNEPAMPITSTHGFPTHLKNLNIDGTCAIGLTIRQQFAMAAMQGLLSNNDLIDGVKEESSVPEICAIMSVACADALIAELNRTEE